MNREATTLHNMSGAEIPAILTRAAGLTQGRVLMLHGLGTSKDEYQNVYAGIADELSRRGVESLRFDFRGHGDSRSSQKDFSFQAQLEDTFTAGKRLSGVNGEHPITVLGTSFGAPPAIALALLSPQIVSRLVLLAPVLDYERTFLYPETPWGGECFGLGRVKGALDSDGLQLEPDFILSANMLRDFFFLQPWKWLSKLSIPVVILHGEKDGMVPFATSQSALSEAPGVRLIAMADTGHGLAEVGDANRTSSRTQHNYEMLFAELAP